MKENFCGACVAIPLALAGAGATTYGSQKQKGTHKKARKIMLWSGIITTLISVMIIIYYLWIKKCKDCR